MPISEEKLKSIYRILRIVIYAIPALVVIIGLYLVLFPVDNYNFYANNPKQSKFDITKDSGTNQLSFGVFPLRSYRYIELTLNFKKTERANCQASNAEVFLQKTYQAFLFPTADPITDEKQLGEMIFDADSTKYPNGSLLHLKPTNEVFFISHGKKILFPGPEIFQAFGYSFDNLVDVQQSDIDQFPDADQKVFLWTMAHPDGTIFQAFPSHTLYLVFNGKKYPIANKALLDEVWPQNYIIPVSDLNGNNIANCKSENSQNQVACRFDSSSLSSIGRYYSFSVKFPENCTLDSVHPNDSQIRFFSEHSTVTVKESIRGIVASVLNRYFFKQ